MKRLVTIICTFSLATVAADASAQTLVGGKVGGSFNQLSQPTDPAGEPTVLFGTAFTGFGFQVGGAVHRPLKQLSFGPLFVDADLLIAHQAATGFAESRETGARRTTAINTTGLHLPALLGVGFAGKGSTFNAAIGPKLMLGFRAGSKNSSEGDLSPGEPLSVKPTTHVGLVGQLGMVFEMAGGYAPVNLRLAYDPFVQKSTRDRFDGYVDFENPGEYQVAFNWTATLMVGWMIDLSGSSEEPPARPTEDAPPGEPEPVEPEEDDDVDLG